MDQLTQIDSFRHTLLDLAIRYGPRLAVALLILIAGAFFSRGLSRWLTRALHRFELESPVRLLLARVAWALCFLLFLIIALQNLGVELLPLIAGLGVAGAGIALATQGVLSNMVAGLSIIFAKPFRVGEYIAIAGVEGTVETITLFSTTLLHVDRSRVVVPNRKIVGEILHNYGLIRQLDVLVGVAYDSDLPAALALIQELLGANARVLKDPAAVVQPVRLADSSVSIAVRPWVLIADQGSATGELYAAIVAAFRARGIGIPFPQREVRLLGAGSP
ncbi:MAG TPA: mechanosensitive ion channel domain-containing protein [Steroidobacteraceae bacterium]|nr:mechanosensitive ion channel domain-containing protein [Steroidobacteraceae bacterium]